MSKKFTPELRERAVRMVLERQAAEGGPRAHCIRVVAPQVGVAEETLRMVQAARPRPGTVASGREPARGDPAAEA